MTSPKEIHHSDHPPAIVSSESVDRQVRGDPFTSETSELLHEPTKIPKPNKNEDHEQVRGDPYSDISEWLQEFRENIVDERVPAHRDSHANSSHEPSLEPMRSVDLGKHSVYTQFPKDRNCEICQRTKITRACRRRIGRVVLRAENFGDLITADHKVLSEGCESQNNHRFAVLVQDLATQWIQSYPCKTKTSQETERSLQKFLEPKRKPKIIYTNNSLEFGKACEDLSWNHCTSTPHRRFGQPVKGPIIPFGSLVEYHPITAKDQSRIHQFGKKVLPGLFLGYAFYAGRIWKGDTMVADLEELETNDASEIYSKRLNAKEVIFPKQGEFIFPIADGRIKTPGGDQELRTSTLVRHRPIQGEGHVDFLGESEGSLPQPHDSLPDAGEVMEETEWQGAREAAWKLAKSVLKVKEHQRATFFSPSENRCLPASTLKPEEREFVVDSGASMHMISKKDLSKAEMDTLTKSCSPTIVITANGEVPTHEEAIVSKNRIYS